MSLRSKDNPVAQLFTIIRRLRLQLPTVTRRLRIVVLAICVITWPAFSRQAFAQQDIRFVSQTGHGYSITHLAVSYEFGLVASRDDVGRICIWEKESGRQIGGFQTNPDIAINDLRFHEDRRVVLFSDTNSETIGAVDLSSNMPILNRAMVGLNKDTARSQVSELNFDDDVKIKIGDQAFIAKWAKNGQLSLFKRNSENSIFTSLPASRVWTTVSELYYIGAYAPDNLSYPNELCCVRIPDCRQVSYKGFQHSTVMVAATGRSQLHPVQHLWLRTIKTAQTQRPRFEASLVDELLDSRARNSNRIGTTTQLVSSPDGAFLAYVEENDDRNYSQRTLSIVNTKNGRNQRITSKLDGGFCFSPSNLLAVSVSREDKSVVEIYSSAKVGSLPYELVSDISVEFSSPTLLFSPDSNLLIADSKVWDIDKLDTPSIRIKLEDLAWPQVAAFSEDSRYLAVARNGELSTFVEVLDREMGFTVKTKFEASLVEDMRFSPSGSYLAIATSNSGVSLRGLQVGEKDWMLGTPGGGMVNAVEFDPTGRYLATTGLTGEGTLWRTTNGTIAARFVLNSLDSWVIADHVGRFDMPDATRTDLAYWVASDDPYTPLSLEMFTRDYYEPDLLRKVLAGEELPAVRPLQDLNRVQPPVEIKEVRPVAGVSDEVDVVVEVSGAKGQFGDGEAKREMKTGVYDLRLFRDGQLVGHAPAGAAEAALPTLARMETEREAWRTATKVCGIENTQSVTFRVRLPRNQAGEEVEFTAYAFNRDRVKSATAKASHVIPPNLKRMTPKAFLVGVGVDAYEGNVVGDLNYAAADARLMLGALAKRFETLDYVVKKVALVSSSSTASQTGQTRLQEQPATKSNIRAAITRLKAVAGPDDLVLLSFSSHGYTDPMDGAFYIFPHDLGDDSQQITPEFLKEHCISSDELTAWLRDVDAGEIVMIVDTCHAAAAIEGKGDFKPGPMGSRGLGQLAYDKGMRILTASQAGDVAIESKRIRQGLLTYALVHDGLEQNRAAIDGRITLGSWLEYAERRVPTLYQEVLDGKIRNAQSEVETSVVGRVSKDARTYEVARQAAPIENGTSIVQKPRLFQYAKKTVPLMRVP